VLIRHLWQLKAVVFLYWCLICAILLTAGGASDVIIPSVVQAIGVLPTDIRRTDIALNIINFKI
jgi:hypothetical protein